MATSALKAFLVPWVRKVCKVTWGPLDHLVLLESQDRKGRQVGRSLVLRGRVEILASQVLPAAEGLLDLMAGPESVARRGTWGTQALRGSRALVGLLARLD